jgi:hypothetical protein
MRRCKVVVYLDEGMQGRCLFGRGDASSLFILDEGMQGRCLFGRGMQDRCLFGPELQVS